MIEKHSFLLLALVAFFALGLVNARADEAPVRDSLKAEKGLEPSLRTNLFWVGAAEANLGVEFPLSEHWSVGGNAGLKTWPRWTLWDWDNVNNPSHWRNFAVVPEVRFYLDQVYQGWFTGADFIYTHFNVGAVNMPLYPEVKENRVQGSFWGAGLFLGYAWWPWEHWRFELEAGIGAGLAAYDRYDCAHCGSKLGEVRKPALVPKLALNIAWNPVSREETMRRRAARRMAGPADTVRLNVLTPPVVFVVHLRDVAAPASRADSLAREYAWVMPIDKYRPFGYDTRPGADSLLYVHFELDKHDLKYDFADNGSILDEVTDVTRKLMADDRSEAVLLSIVGLASIEGKAERNDTLSIRRARALRDYVYAETGFPKNHFELLGKGEAWDWFQGQLNAIPDGGFGLSASDVDRLQRMLSEVPDPDARERRLKADKALYQKVLKGLLEDQRNSGYLRMYYANYPDAATDRLNTEVMPLLKAKRYAEARTLMESDPDMMARVKADAEALNCYGIACYFTALDEHDEDAEARAFDMVQEAARKGSEAAAVNLDGMREYSPARKEYEAWKAAMEEDNN